MKLFEMPKAELVKFDIADVITTSGEEEEEEEEEGGRPKTTSCI